MKTITIDIPDDKISEVLSQLKKLGVIIESSSQVSSDLNSSLDETDYLLPSPVNAERLLNSIEIYNNLNNSDKLSF